MNDFVIVNLRNVLERIGENNTKKILSEFYCPHNADVEYFLRYKAIEFCKQSVSSTYLVMAFFMNTYVFCGYFTLANKVVAIHKDALPSHNWEKRVSRFSLYDEDLEQYCMSVPLIGQLSKNFYNGYNKLITGNELLTFAINQVKKMHIIVGGKIVYLECEDNQVLVNFYTSYGFTCFGKKKSKRNEAACIIEDDLLQMLKYL